MCFGRNSLACIRDVFPATVTGSETATKKTAPTTTIAPNNEPRRLCLRIQTGQKQKIIKTHQENNCSHVSEGTNHHRCCLVSVGLVRAPSSSEPGPEVDSHHIGSTTTTTTTTTNHLSGADRKTNGVSAKCQSSDFTRTNKFGLVAPGESNSPAFGTVDESRRRRRRSNENKSFHHHRH